MNISDHTQKVVITIGPSDKPYVKIFLPEKRNGEKVDANFDQMLPTTVAEALLTEEALRANIFTLARFVPPHLISLCQLEWRASPQ